jgi:hypothetical protein
MTAFFIFIGLVAWLGYGFFFQRKRKTTSEQPKKSADFDKEFSELLNTPEGQGILREKKLAELMRQASDESSEDMQSALEKTLENKKLAEKILEKLPSWMKRKPKSDQTKTYSTPIGDYRKGARNFGWWMLIYSLASLATFIVWVLYVHNEQRWFVITPATISIAVIWLAVAILVIAGFSTVEAGYVGVVTSFKRYVGTVNSGLFFAVRGINEYFEVFLGEQINELHMTNEKGKGSGAVELTDHVSIGVEATVWYKVVKEGAHLALFNTADFVTFINREMDSLLRSFLSCYSFQEINNL